MIEGAKVGLRWWMIDVWGRLGGSPSYGLDDVHVNLNEPQ